MRKKETLTLSVPPGTKEKLEEIAQTLGILWGSSPSASGLIAAIANGKLKVSDPNFSHLDNPSPEQIEALKEAAKILIDFGKIKQAQIVLSLLG